MWVNMKMPYLYTSYSARYDTHYCDVPLTSWCTALLLTGVYPILKGFGICQHRCYSHIQHTNKKMPLHAPSNNLKPTSSTVKQLVGNTRCSTVWPIPDTVTELAYTDKQQALFIYDETCLVYLNRFSLNFHSLL